MMEMPHTPDERILVNLAALQRGLKEMAANIKSPDQPANDRPGQPQGPTLVIRGK
jgi:hypothetical protein